MIKRLLALTTIGVLLSGCYMVPLAFIGPATSGFTTASFIQSGITTGTSYLVKQETGKFITDHILETINSEVVKQAYFPEKKDTSYKISYSKDKN